MAALPLRVLVVALIAFCALLAGVVTLVVSSPALQAQLGAHATAITAAAIAALPAVAAWLTGRQVRATQSAHAAQLAVIGENTNGKLDARIRSGVRAELSAAGLIPTVPDPVVPVVIPDQPTRAAVSHARGNA